MAWNAVSLSLIVFASPSRSPPSLSLALSPSRYLSAYYLLTFVKCCRNQQTVIGKPTKMLGAAFAPTAKQIHGPRLGCAPAAPLDSLVANDTWQLAARRRRQQLPEMDNNCIVRNLRNSAIEGEIWSRKDDLL